MMWCHVGLQSHSGLRYPIFKLMHPIVWRIWISLDLRDGQLWVRYSGFMLCDWYLFSISLQFIQSVPEFRFSPFVSKNIPLCWRVCCASCDLNVKVQSFIPQISRVLVSQYTGNSLFHRGWEANPTEMSILGHYRTILKHILVYC